MIAYRSEWRGDRIALLIRFENAGDGLGMHSHEPGNYHDTEVVSGRVVVVGYNNAWSRVLSAGDRMDLRAEMQHHDIIAIEPGAIVANVYHDPNPGLEAMVGGDWRTD